MEELEPKIVIMENVANMSQFKMHSRNGNSTTMYAVVLYLLMELGYQCTMFVAQAAALGVPQDRRR